MMLTENKDPMVQRAVAVATLKAEALEVLKQNILPFWMKKMKDREHGGFYGQMTGRYELNREADKGAILNARILWSFSAAYRVLSQLTPESSQLSAYLEAATQAKDYILDHFIDKEYGGVYWSVDYLGQPKDTKKQFYALGFALYGLSEYARATGDREALDYALQLFDCIEEHAFDPENNGYIEATTRDWQPIADMRLSDLDQNYPKSQNTHLHIIEPYTNLLRALREMQAAQSCAYVPAIGSILPIDIAVPHEMMIRVEGALRNLIDIFTEKILNPFTHHLDLFFEMDWTRGASQLESYGHDIECSWLLHEAALVLGDEEVLRKVEPIVQMVAKASEKGLNADGSMIHEGKAPLSSPEGDTLPCKQTNEAPSGAVGGAKADDDLHWWVQAENVVGWLNIYQHFGDEEALQRALRCWQYIKKNLIDWEHGEWYWSRRADGTLNQDDDHAGFWKCPYHNSRMCLEIIERF
jgi:mannobiose 2-epimerase